MRYVYVENGVILEGPKTLPVSWRNYSVLPYLSEEQLRDIGWLPYYFVEADLSQGPIITDPVVYIDSTKVTEYQQRRERTPEEDAEYISQVGDDVREKRNNLLNSSDWTQLPDSPVDKTVWATYRDELRRIPEQAGFPLYVQWPVPPA